MYVLLLLPSLHLVNAVFLKLRSRIELIWALRDYSSNIMTFVHSHLNWFLNTLLFIKPDCCILFFKIYYIFSPFKGLYQSGSWG